MEVNKTREGSERRVAEEGGLDSDSCGGGGFMSSMETFAPWERSVRAVESPRPEELSKGSSGQFCRF